MVDLSKTFTFCLHCKNRTAEPRNVCPACDWPRAHSAETPQSEVGLLDLNNVLAAPALQSGQVAQVIQPHMADVKVDSKPVLIPGQAPPNLAAIAELGVIPTSPASPLERLRTLTLAPEDPVEEPEE